MVPAAIIIVAIFAALVVWNITLTIRNRDKDGKQ